MRGEHESKSEVLWGEGGSVGDEQVKKKPFQGQHGNITFSRYKTAVSCGGAVQEQEGGQRTAGGRGEIKDTQQSLPEIRLHGMRVGDRCTVRNAKERGQLWSPNYASV